MKIAAGSNIKFYLLCDLLGWRSFQFMTQPIEPNPAVVTAIENRRTIHEFRPDPIAEETLWRILAAIQNIQLAAWGQGIGTHWNTGRVTRLPETEALLDLFDRGEELVGFLYLGYPARIPEPPKRRPIEDFVRRLP